jgi:hypothetical protein
VEDLQAVAEDLQAVAEDLQAVAEDLHAVVEDLQAVAEPSDCMYKAALPGIRRYSPARSNCCLCLAE